MDDEYAIFREMWLEAENTTDPSYVVSNSVRLCTTENVNEFGAKFIPGFYFANFLLSYLGNSLVLLIIYKYEKLTTVTNIFLLNLVFSNLLFATSLPFWATYHMSEWIFGSAMCKLVTSAYTIGFYSSILFLTLMTFDRYLAVVHAVAAVKSRKRAYAIIASVVVWCVSIVASVKDFVLQNVREDRTNGLLCDETGYDGETVKSWRRATYYQQFLLFFLMPLFMMLYCYISITIRIMSTRMKERCRAIKLIFVIIFTFFACWTPYNVVVLLRAIKLSSPDEDEEKCSDSLDYALYVTRNIAYLYCCISPMFYTFVGKKFQRHFTRLMVKKIPCLKAHISVSSYSTRSASQKTPQTANEY